MKYVIEINGAKLELPCEYSDVKELGFQIDSDYNIKTLNAGNTATYTVTNSSGQEFEITFQNKRETEQATTECTIVKLCFDDENSPDMILANGVKLGRTEDAVRSIMGEPDLGYGYGIKVGTNDYKVAIGYPYLSHTDINISDAAGNADGISDFVTYSSVVYSVNNSRKKEISFISISYEGY